MSIQVRVSSSVAHARRKKKEAGAADRFGAMGSAEAAAAECGREPAPASHHAHAVAPAVAGRTSPAERRKNQSVSHVGSIASSVGPTAL